MKRSLIFLALVGCGAIDAHKAPPKGWPDLQVIEHFVPHAEMRDKCSKYVPWYASAEACAEWHFDKDECHIWFSKDFPPQQWVIEHERMHCAGYDHVDSTAASDAFHAYSGVIAARALAKALKQLRGE